MTKPDRITEFRGKNRFLSNFYPFPVEYEDILYPTVEHAYQAAKTSSLDARLAISKLSSPGAAKAVGANLVLPKNWEEQKLEVMEFLLRKKFGNIDMRQRLLQTEEVQLIEGNSWGDTFWGMCRGQGENHLGRILMSIRADLRRAQES